MLLEARAALAGAKLGSEGRMKVEVIADPEAVAKTAARFIAAQAVAAVAARGRFNMAVSGGHTPWQMLRALSAEAVPWTCNSNPTHPDGSTDVSDDSSLDDSGLDDDNV